MKESVENVLEITIFSMLNLKLKRSEPLNMTIHSTVKRETDFLKKVWLDSANEPEIVQIEFQSNPDAEMHYRMLEYLALVSRKYKLPMRQYVVYLGNKKWEYPTTLNFVGLKYSFQLVWLREYSYKWFLKSDIPEIVLAAVFADFKNQKPNVVVKLILRRIFKLSKTDADLEKYLTHLKVLSKLVRIQEVVLEEINTMPITYDIKTDVIYQQGMQQGMQKGIMNEKIKMALKLLDEKLSEDFVARVTGLPIQEIESLKTNKSGGFNNP